MAEPDSLGDLSRPDSVRRSVEALASDVDTPQEAKRFIEELRHKRDRESTQDTRSAIETLVANNTPWDGLWAFELVQNALDAGAT